MKKYFVTVTVNFINVSTTPWDRAICNVWSFGSNLEKMFSDGFVAGGIAQQIENFFYGYFRYSTGCMITNFSVECYSYGEYSKEKTLVFEKKIKEYVDYFNQKIVEENDDQYPLTRCLEPGHY